ncbi:MAG: nitrate reductase cytochrome c-type subunit [Sulfurovum sp.]
MGKVIKTLVVLLLIGAGIYGVMQMVEKKNNHSNSSDIVVKKENKATKVEEKKEEKQEAVKEEPKASLIDLNEDASSKVRIDEENLGNKASVTEKELGLRKTNLYNEEKAKGSLTDYTRPVAGTSTKFERAFLDAPPMIPHSVDGLLPITTNNNQCLGCHMPEVAKSMGATPLSETHFTNYRPHTIMKDGKVFKEGQELGSELKNTSDIKIAKTTKTKTLYQGRFNCTQCHAPQSKTKTDVANTFRPDFSNDTEKASSSLIDTMNEGVE